MNETWLLVILSTLLVLAVIIAIYPLNRQYYRAQLAIVIVLIAGSILGVLAMGITHKMGRLPAPARDKSTCTSGDEIT